MTLDRAVMMFAGFMVLVSLALGFYVSPWWFLLNAFVGLNLIQASVTGFCPAAIVFRKLGVKSGSAFE
ncbi:YgaP family membrane protein [Martelella sp. AMO21009]